MPELSLNKSRSHELSELRLLAAPRYSPEWYTQAHEENFTAFRNERLLVRLDREAKDRRKQRHSEICNHRDVLRDSESDHDFAALSAKHSVESADARRSMILAARDIRQLTGETDLSGKRVLDLFSGSAIADAIYHDARSIERFSPWFSRLCARRGAEVLAIDSRPQASDEEFTSLVADLSSPLRVQALISGLGTFDFIHCSSPGLTSFRRVSGSFGEKAIKSWEKAMAPILLRALKGGGALYWNGKVSRVVGPPSRSSVET